MVKPVLQRSPMQVGREEGKEVAWREGDFPEAVFPVNQSPDQYSLKIQVTARCLYCFSLTSESCKHSNISCTLETY